MRELSKTIVRRQRDPRFMTTFLVGSALDIGGRPDPLSIYVPFFPLLSSVQVWDVEDGDAQFLATLPDSSFDTVLSSHTLEHMQDPLVALRNWFRVLKPGGHLVVTVPDEDLYEQGVFDDSDQFNKDHKYTFTVQKEKTWSAASINVLALVQRLGARADIRLISVEDATYRYGLPRIDQTRSPITDCSIEFVVRKRSDLELTQGGRLPQAGTEIGVYEPYARQYALDQRAAAAAYPNQLWRSNDLS